ISTKEFPSRFPQSLFRDYIFERSYCAKSFVISAFSFCLSASDPAASRCFTSSSIFSARISVLVSAFLGFPTLYLSSIDAILYLCWLDGHDLGPSLFLWFSPSSWLDVRARGCLALAS